MKNWPCAHPTVSLVADRRRDPGVFRPAFAPPADVSLHRYFHVIGTSVFVADEPMGDAGHHFLGMLDDAACWAIDVPSGEDPSDGAALDLYSFLGRASETEWVVAGRAV